MSKGVGFRPQLLPPRGRRLERSRRPLITCITVSSCIAALVFVVFGLTAYNIYSNRFGHNQHDYHLGDMVSMLQASNDLSSTFCDAYVVEPFSKTEFYLLPSRAEIDPGYRHDSSFTIKMHPGHGPIYLYRAHHLLVNTSVSIRACRDLEEPVLSEESISAEFLVISGRDDFEEWQKHFNRRHVRHQVIIPENASCENSTTSPSHYSFTVSHSNDYYFVLVQHHREPRPRLILAGDIYLYVNISSTRYDLSQAISVCNTTETSCRFAVNWGSKRDVVAWVRGDRDVSDASISFMTDCVERVVFWVPVFGVLPVVIVCLTSLGCYYVLVFNRSLESRYSRKPDSRSESRPSTSYGSVGEEEAPLLSASAPPAVMSDDDEGCASIQD